MTPWNLRVTLTAISMASFETLRPSALTAIDPAVERERKFLIGYPLTRHARL